MKEYNLVTLFNFYTGNIRKKESGMLLTYHTQFSHLLQVAVWLDPYQQGT